MPTALLGGACRECSLPRLVSRRSVGFPELAGGQRPAVAAVAAVAAGRQRREVAWRGVEPLLALLGLLVPLALDLIGHVQLLEADGQLQRLVRVRVGARVRVRVRFRSWAWG